MITGMQKLVCERYGWCYRVGDLKDPVSIRSCLGSDGPGGAGAPDPATLAGVQEITTYAREQLLLAREIFGFDTGMVGTMDMICGRGLRPREIAAEDPEERKRRRHADALVHTLTNGADILIAKRWHLGPPAPGLAHRP